MTGREPPPGPGPAPTSGDAPRPGPRHGGGVDAAAARFGGARRTWIDLSTGINPMPYPLADVPDTAWHRLPDRAAETALTDAARAHWRAPADADILPVPGLSAIISRLPALVVPGAVAIPGPTYNEYAPAFAAAGWQVDEADPDSGPRRNHDAAVVVHPNNPTGRFHPAPDPGLRLRVIDESFCDLAPKRSHIALADTAGTLVLKGLGKFWGLAGLRLGFVIGDPVLVATLRDMVGPWAVSSPALDIGRAALSDPGWAEVTRDRLHVGAARLDKLAERGGLKRVGGTDLFRLYTTPDAHALRDRLAADHRVWTRAFDWSATHIRIGLPGTGQWSRVADALTA